MTTILVVTSLTHRALDQESLITAWLKKGCRVIVLNFYNQDPFHVLTSYINYQFIPFVISPGAFNIFRAVLRVITLCWQHSVDVVFAHLEHPSFVSVLANYFVNAKVVAYRHHADYGILNGFAKTLSYKFTYSFAPQVIVVSNHAKSIMIEKEKVKADKISVVPLAFDFTLFKKPIGEKVRSLRKSYNTSLLLLAVGRLTELKRHYHSIDVVKQLIDDGLDAKLILLGTGEGQLLLEKYIRDNNLHHNVFLCGFSKDVLTFMMAADFVVHPSISESSSIIVKEAGIAEKPCIVCRGVGDFDEYIIHNRNGFLTNKENFVTEAVDIIKSYHQDKQFLHEIGKNLNRDILRLFDINLVIKKYDQFLNDTD